MLCHIQNSLITNTYMYTYEYESERERERERVVIEIDCTRCVVEAGAVDGDGG